MANRIYCATGLTGGTTGTLDSIRGGDLINNDMAIVINSPNVYFYVLDADSAAAESSPTVISPDTNAGDKRWILQSLYVEDITMVVDDLTVGDDAEIKGNLQVGDADGTGANLILYSNTSGDHVVYDATAKTLTLTDVNLVMAAGGAINAGDNNITNVGNIALDSISADDGSSFSVSSNWTNAGNTIADLGVVTTVDIDSGSIDGAAIGVNSANAGNFTSIGATTTGTIIGTEIDATTDFTIGDTVITDGIITDSTGFKITGGTITLEGSGETLAVFNDDGSVDLYYNGTKTFEVRLGGINADAIESLSANTDLTLTANGTGVVTIGDSWTATGQTCADLGTVTTANIDGGTIDGVTLGGAASVTITNADINGGTVDGVTIFGVATGVSGSDVTLITGTAGTTNYPVTFNVDGDLIEATSMDFNNINMTNVDIDSGAIDGVTIGAAAAPTVTNLGTVTTCDIDGGTLDGMTIGGASAPTITDATVTQLTMAAAGKIVMAYEPTSDETAQGIIVTGTVDSNTYGAMGLVYLNSVDGNWDTADKDAESTAGVMLAMALGTTGSINVLLQGVARDDTWNWTAGDQLFVGDDGAITADVSAYATGDIVRCVGWALTDDSIYFNPSVDFITVA